MQSQQPLSRGLAGPAFTLCRWSGKKGSINYFSQLQVHNLVQGRFCFPHLQFLHVDFTLLQLQDTRSAYFGLIGGIVSQTGVQEPFALVQPKSAGDGMIGEVWSETHHMLA